MYQVIARYYKVLTSVAFFILSCVTPCTSHIALSMNQNWSVSSFPTPLNTDNFIALAILTCSGGGGGTGEDGGEGNEVGGGVVGVVCTEAYVLLN